jgi:hypothetical protein
MAKSGLYSNKACYKCKLEKPIELYYKGSNTKDGLHSWCKDCCNIGNKKSIIKKYSTFEGRIPTFLYTCKTSAIKRKQEFSLTADDLRAMWKEQDGICCYSGLPMKLEPNTLFSVSVERVNNSVGYTPDNTVLICKGVNSMKSSMTGEEFYTFCSSITNWLSDNNGNLGVRFQKYD